MQNFDRDDSMCFDCDESDRLFFIVQAKDTLLEQCKKMPEIQLKLPRKESMVIF